MARISRTTVKAFLRKHADAILIRTESNFDGMTDCTVYERNPQFRAAPVTDLDDLHTMGVFGAWFVGGGHDYIVQYDTPTHTGYAVSNCCGSFVLAIVKPQVAA